MDPTIILMVSIAVMVLVLGLSFAVITRCYHRVPANGVLVVTSQQGVRVMRRGGVVVPVIQRAELLDLRPKTIDIRRVGREGIVCRDNIRVDVTATFTLVIGLDPLLAVATRARSGTIRHLDARNGLLYTGSVTGTRGGYSSGG